MSRRTRREELDSQIECLLRGATSELRPEWRSLAMIVADLEKLPSAEFRERLKSELVETIAADEPSSTFKQVTSATTFAEILPGLAETDHRMFPADQRSFVFSFLSHTALIVLIASGIWVGRVPLMKKTTISELTFAPVGKGGGGSGNNSPIPITKGTPPKMSEQQLAPPVVVVRNSHAILPVQSTVVGPPNVTLPQSNQIGDLISTNVVIPSDGSGSGGGAGSGSGTGLGGGAGLGVGSGFNRGAGGGVLTLDGDIVAPRPIYDPEPEYSEEARKVKQQGTVILSLIVDAQGRPRNIHIARALGMGLDEKAVEAVSKWKFNPGTKDGKPVAVKINVEVAFRLY